MKTGKNIVLQRQRKQMFNLFSQRAQPMYNMLEIFNKILHIASFKIIKEKKMNLSNFLNTFKNLYNLILQNK